MAGSYSFSQFKSSELSSQPHYLVVGHPVSHSLSPVMHNIALDRHQLPGRYVAVDLTPGDLPAFTSWINNEQLLGCNITIPYKHQFLEIVDKLSDEAKHIKAVNTLAKSNNGSIIEGHNTDLFGFLEPLKSFTDQLSYSRAIIFGTGGASKAVQAALVSIGYEELILVSRNPDSAMPLQTETYVNVVSYNQWHAFSEETDLIVNTTPVGMGNLKSKSIIDDRYISLLNNKLCYDLIYNPIETRFLQQAKTAGANTLSGLDMLIWQGSRSFEIWTGHKFPFDKIKQELMEFFNA